ncbi:MAG: hypothetical protein FJ358_01535 [Thaumarchaeota archaeon]|nr:hypothetical protein [Nitrososphaerota archaeon]
MSQETELKVSITFEGTTVEFKGSPESILLSVTEYLTKIIPTLDLAKQISVNYSVAELIRFFGDHVKITPEGPRVWNSERKFSDKEMILLQLIGTKIAGETGRAHGDFLTLAEIASSTGINPKSISSRLSEVLKVGYVERQSIDSTAKYRITTAGINWLTNTLSKKN